MTTSSLSSSLSSGLQLERRIGQRFLYALPVSFREVSSALEGRGFTQNLSSRGVFLFTDTPLRLGAGIELTLNMPSEITLGENMRVRCRGTILRVVKPAKQYELSHPETRAETKLGVAIRFDGYEYLSDPAQSFASYPRVAALHPHHEEDAPVSAQPALEGF